MNLGLGGVILAAGESTRMGRDKALLPWPPEAQPSRKRLEKDGAPAALQGTILSAAIQALSQFCDMVIVVAGNNELALEPVAYGCGAILVRNPNPERGQFSSLQTGLQEVLSRGRDSAMVTLVDRPPPSAQTLNQLTSAFADRDHAVWGLLISR